MKFREVPEDFREQRSGQAPKPRHWEDRIKERQTYFRKAWLMMAKDMALGCVPEEQELAKRIAACVSFAPPMKTERHELQEKVAGQLQLVQAQQGRGESWAEEDQEQD